MMVAKKNLSDILAAGNGGNIRDAWDNTTAADEFSPLPPGEYTFSILAGELFQAKTGTFGYKLTLEVTEGEHEGRRVWHNLWLTPAALPMTKRDLAKIGITTLEQLEQPLPAGILIRGKLAINHDDDGIDTNRLRRFEYVGVERGDAFAPEEEEIIETKQGDLAEPDLFSTGSNAQADNTQTDTAGPPTKPKRKNKTADNGGNGEGNAP
jgi:hypothetical protein